MPPNSEAEFLFEHYWGYTKVDSETTCEYAVRHPRWRLHAVKRYRIDFDFGRIFGSEFAFLQNRKPDSVFMAEGSPISVSDKKKITRLK